MWLVLKSLFMQMLFVRVHVEGKVSKFKPPLVSFQNILPIVTDTVGVGPIEVFRLTPWLDPIKGPVFIHPVTVPGTAWSRDHPL
jgi:hypothetical protein